MHQTATFGILPAKYRCSNCGYEGTLVLELDDDPRSGGPDDRREVA
jgi:predicted nucleic acid-binding Zn ribbon protein